MLCTYYSGCRPNSLCVLLFLCPFFFVYATVNLLMPCLRTICRCSILIVWASFVPLLVRVCFCLCCVHIIPSAGLICCVFCCFFVFFPPIIVNVNLLMLCLRTICRCSILIVWASFVLLLVRVCFCLCCGHIVPGLGLICCVFCFFFEFFFVNCQCQFTDAMFAHNLQVSKFIVWTSFTLLFARVCFCLGCLYDFCGTWLMCCVFIARFPFSTRQNEFNTIRAVFVVRDHACKTCPEHRLLPRFPLFSCPPVQIPPTAPM